MTNLKDLFVDPPTRYRGAPFWSWNDALEVEELVRQVHDMKAHGMGGFFMHSREGLETEYMGEHWLTCIRETVAAAREAGTYAWLYDEDRWPSGAAGGLVPARGGDAFRAKSLTMARQAEYAPAPDVLAVFRARVDGESLRKAERVPADMRWAAEEGETLLVFRRKVADPSEWFNDDAPADNLNPDAVAAFLDITYAAYYDEVGADFGETVPGIFTDEPNVGGERMPPELRRVPWTDGLPAYFAERRGYDVLDVAPWIFLDGASSPKARHDFWRTISERFTEAFSRQIGAWCAGHGLAFTGHYLNENEMGTGIVRGGAIMPHYPHQHVPGIDMLTVQTHENLTVKQCSSVAHQFGREFVLSETYGCSGWEMTFEQQKWVGDWQYVLGVSMRCQHLALYTLRGCRKRDYPPAFNYNTTWWKYNGVVEDYFARVGLLTTQGRAVRDVLVLHPVATAWSMVGDAQDLSGGVSAANAFGERLNAFTRAVLATHYDFDFGDEQIMAEHARLEGDTLWIEQAAYRVVIVPPGTRTLLPATVALLERFIAAGGAVIAFDPVPTQIEAEASVRAAALFARPSVMVLDDVAALQFALETALPRRVSITDERGHEVGRFLYMQRDTGERSIFFVVNNDAHNAYRARLTFEGVGRLEAWNLLTGEITPVPVALCGDAVRFEADFGPAGSRMYVLDPTAEPVLAAGDEAWPGTQRHRRYTSATFVGPACRFRRTDPNVLTLDTCRYTMARPEKPGAEEEAEAASGAHPKSDVLPVWQAQRQIRDALGMRNVWYNGLPQRYQWAHEPHPGDGTPVTLEFRFEVRDVPETPVYLLVEGARDFEIALNGEAVSNEPVGWYLDRSFHKVALPALQAGTNTLTLACDYENRMEIEDCFLLGDFAVDVERVIVQEPETLHFGDWTLQGYLHYAGGIVYLDTLTYDPEEDAALTLWLGRRSAVDVAVHVNGAVVGHVPWEAANGFDLTPHLQPGANELGIEVVGSPRNMLGPLHRKAGYEGWTDSRSFRREGEAYTPGYVVWPWGLFEQVRILRQ